MSVTNAVLKYLRDQNRPYSANDVVLNLHNEFSKTAVQKALDQLVEAKSIFEKTYGKQKVYCIVQEEANKSDLAAEIEQIDRRVTEATESLRKLEAELKSAEKMLEELEAAPTTEQAEKRVVDAEHRVTELKDRLDPLRLNRVKISKEDRDKVDKVHGQVLKEYRKRKRICMDMVDSVLEGYPKSKKDLFEEVGIETDEEVGFQMP